MAANTEAIFPNGVRNPPLLIENADGTTIQDLVIGGADASLVLAISVTSDDTADKDLLVYHSDGVDDYLIGRITIPDGSGSNGVDQTVSLLNQTNFPHLKDDLCYALEAGHKIRIAAQAALTSGKKIYIVASVGDY